MNKGLNRHLLQRKYTNGKTKILKIAHYQKKYKSIQWVPSHTSQIWPLSKHLQTINAEGVESGASCIAVGNVNWYSLYKLQYGDFFSSFRNKITWPSHPLLGIYPRKSWNEKTQVPSVHCNTIYILDLEAMQMSVTDKWIKCDTYIQ